MKSYRFLRCSILVHFLLAQSFSTHSQSMADVVLDTTSRMSPCRAGTFLSSDGCEPCPIGTFNPQAGATSRSACRPCPLGTEASSLGISCRNCPAGEYQDELRLSSCKRCPFGFQPDRRSQIISRLQNCPRGTFGSIFGRLCSDCSAGTYQDEPGSTRCTRCPDGTFNAREGAKSVTDCQECPIGTEDTILKRSCEKCSAGTYQDEIGMARCKRCPDGTFNGGEGATCVSDCQKCPKGTEDTTFRRDCSDCPAGRYQDEPGATTCLLCPSGTINLRTGSKSVSDCEKCPRGTSESGLRTSCTRCSAGRYQDEPGSRTCQICPFGTFGTREGAKSVTDCQKCPKGTRGETFTRTSCRNCTAGTYQDEMGSTICDRCPSGTFNTIEGAKSVTACRPCPPGTTSSTQRTSCE